MHGTALAPHVFAALLPFSNSDIKIKAAMNSVKSNIIVSAASMEDYPKHDPQHVRDNNNGFDDNAIVIGDVNNDVDEDDNVIVNGGVGGGNHDVHYYANAFVPPQPGPYAPEWMGRLKDIRSRNTTYNKMWALITESQRRELLRNHFRRVRKRKHDAAIIGRTLEFDPATTVAVAINITKITRIVSRALPGSLLTIEPEHPSTSARSSAQAESSPSISTPSSEAPPAYPQSDLRAEGPRLHKPVAQDDVRFFFTMLSLSHTVLEGI